MSGPWEKFKTADSGGASGPWSKFQSPNAPTPPPEEPGVLEKIKNNLGENMKSIDAFGTGVGNTMTLNYLPQIEAGADTGVQAIKDLATKGNVGNWDDVKQNYQTNKDRVLAHEAQLQNDRPAAYAAGTVGGLFTSPVAKIAGAASKVPALAARIIPGAEAAAESFPMLAKFIKAGATAGVMGAAANPGDTKGQSGDLQLDQRLHNAEVAAPIGVGGEMLVEGAQKVPDWVSGVRRWMTAKQLGANTTQLKQLLKDLPEADGQRIDRVEKFMDDNGLLNMGTHFADVESKSKDIADTAGKKLENLYKTADQTAATLPEISTPAIADTLEATRLHGPDMANEFLASEAERLKDTKNGDKILKQLEGELGGPDDPGSLTKMGKDVSLDRMWKYRKSVDEDINFARSQGNATLERSYVNLRNFLNDKILGKVAAIDSAAGTSHAPEIGATNQLYSDAALVNKISNNTKAREMSKYVPGVVGTMTGGGVGVYDYEKNHNLPEAILKGAAAGIATRGLRAVAPALTYRGATALEPYLNNASQVLKQQGGAAFSAPWLNMTKENR